MKKRLPFKTDTPLAPGDPAFSDSVYRSERGRMEAYGVRDYSPKVICSPRKTGKTTQLNLIYNQQMQVSRDGNADLIEIEIPEKEGGVTEQDLREKLTRELRSKDRGTLVDIIQGSKLIERNEHRKVLGIIDADNLHVQALDWLLRGVTELVESGDIPEEYKVQVIIDGSFAVETMTAGPNSPYPMQQIFPREFKKNEQEQFIDPRLKTLGLEISPSGYRALWEATHGDKYLTQALCMRISKNHQTGVRKTVVKDEIIENLDAYLKEDPKKDDLKPDLLRSFLFLSENLGGRETSLRNLLETIETKWEGMSREARAVAYKGGIIRRTGEQSVKLRAPMVLDIYSDVEQRVRQVRAVLNSHFALEGVKEKHKADARNVYQSIIEASYLNSLRILHVGTGKKISHNRVEIQAIALGQGQYSGVWEIEEESSIKIGDEVWGILWSHGIENGGRDSNLRIFPVKNP